MRCGGGLAGRRGSVGAAPLAWRGEQLAGSGEEKVVTEEMEIAVGGGRQAVLLRLFHLVSHITIIDALIFT